MTTDQVAPVGDSEMSGASEPWRPRGAPGRASTAQGHAWRTLRIAFAFFLAAPLAAIAVGPSQLWLPLHLVLLGGVLSAISAASQLFAVTWSASPAPSNAVAATQRWLLAGGAVGVIAARQFALPAIVMAAAGAAVLLALLLLAGILLRIRSHAVTPRFNASIDCYLMAIAMGIAGSAVGVAMGTGIVDARPAVRDAHIVFNLFGLVGIVVLGTLPTFVATQVRTKVSRRATPRRLRVLGIAMAVATALAAAGSAGGSVTLSALGFGAYVSAAVGVVALLPRLGGRQRRWAGPRLLQLVAALGWWVLVPSWATLAAVGLVESTDRMWLTLAVGGYAQLVVASLAYLGPILRGRDHRSQQRAFAMTRSWLSPVAGNAAAIGLVAAWWPLVVISLGAWVVDVAIRGVLVARVGRLG